MAEHESANFRNDLRSQLVTTGTAAAEQWLATRANRKMSDVNRRRLAGHIVNALWDDIVDSTLGLAEYIASEQVAAANERAETAERKARLLVTGANELDRQYAETQKATRAEFEAAMDELRDQRDEARARLAELGEAETQRRILVADGTSHPVTEWDLENRALWVPSVRLEEREVYPTPWRVVADATGAGLSATETDTARPDAREGADTTASAPQGPQEATG